VLSRARKKGVEEMRRFVRGLNLGLSIAVFVVLALHAGPAAFAKVWMRGEPGMPEVLWKNGKRVLKVYVPPGESQQFKDAVDAARGMWNNANTGWTFESTTDPAQADITAHTGNLPQPPNPPPNLGESQEMEEVQFPNFTTGFDVTMDKNGGDKGWGGDGDPNTYNLKTAVAHELGHCIGLDHTTGAADVMNPGIDSAADDKVLTDQDKKEARLSNEVTREAWWWHWTVSMPGWCGSDGGMYEIAATNTESSEPMRLETAVMVEFEALDPSSLFGVVNGWDPQFIHLTMRAYPGADEMEGFMLNILYPDRGWVSYFGTILVTPMPYSGLPPHAVAPDLVVEKAGLPVMIDASGSYHEDPAGVLFYHWQVYRPAGTVFTHTCGYPPYGTFWLPSGDNSVELMVEDQWGNRDFDYTQVHVLARSSPPQTFGVGWNYFSIPLPAQDPTPDAVLGLSCSGILWRWDVYLKTTLVYHPPFTSFDLNQGEGYLLRLTLPIDVSYESDALYWLWEKRLGKQGWAWVGFPAVDELALGYPYFMDLVKVQYPLQSGNVRSAAEDRASGSPWLSWSWSYWDPELQAFKTFTPFLPFGDNVCRPWLGYLAYVNIGTATGPSDPDQVTLCCGLSPI
jgi:hypothetical protein